MSVSLSIITWDQETSIGYDNLKYQFHMFLWECFMDGYRHGYHCPTLSSQLSVVHVPQVVVSTVTRIINRHVSLTVIKQCSFMLEFRRYKNV